MKRVPPGGSEELGAATLLEVRILWVFSTSDISWEGIIYLQGCQVRPTARDYLLGVFPPRSKLLILAANGRGREEKMEVHDLSGRRKALRVFDGFHLLVCLLQWSSSGLFPRLGRVLVLSGDAVTGAFRLLRCFPGAGYWLVFSCSSALIGVHTDLQDWRGWLEDTAPCGAGWLADGSLLG